MSEAFLTQVHDWRQATGLEQPHSPVLLPALPVLLSLLNCICLPLPNSFYQPQTDGKLPKCPRNIWGGWAAETFLFELFLTQVKHLFPTRACELWLTENPWLVALLSLVWGGTTISARVFHPFWTACQCWGCSTEKTNCMYPSNSSHLIAWLKSSILFLLRKIKVLTISPKPQWFLHVDCNQQVIIGTEPHPFSMLSPAGIALPIANLPVCLSAPSSALLLALVGSG